MSPQINLKLMTLLMVFVAINGLLSCENESIKETDVFQLKNGSYTGSFIYDSLHLWESFGLQNNDFVEYASGGVLNQKYPMYCLTKGAYDIIDDSIYFNNIQIAQPPDGIIADYGREYLLMGSYFVEDLTDSSIVFWRVSENGKQEYDLKLYFETE